MSKSVASLVVRLKRMSEEKTPAAGQRFLVLLQVKSEFDVLQPESTKTHSTLRIYGVFSPCPR